MTPMRLHATSRARLAAAAVAVLLAVLALPAAARAGDIEDLRARERAAAERLDASTAAVKAAATALEDVQARLAAAESLVAATRGRVAAVEVKAAAARLAAAQAAQDSAQAAAQLEAADLSVDRSRRDVGAVARYAYTRGRLSELRTLMDVGEPREVLQRAQMLRAIFAWRNDSVERLSDERLTRAATAADARRRAGEAAQAQERVDALQRDAVRMAEDARRAATSVAVLTVERADAVEAARAVQDQDERAYRAAQAESEALAARIRAAAAARQEAEREAARRAAAAAAAQRAAEARKPAAGSRARPAAPAPQPAPARAGRMVRPTTGPTTSGYGYRTHPIYGDRRLHAGIDLGPGSGAPIVAALDGTVIARYFSPSYGNLTVIDHGLVDGEPLTTTYAHQSSTSVREGQLVARGQLIGRVGNTGNSTGPHLHFETRVDGNPVDPMRYLS